MSTIRINTPCTEFGRTFTLGQVVVDLSELEATAMDASGLAKFLQLTATALPNTAVVPITSVQFANPAAYGFNVKSDRIYEFNGGRYHWGGSGFMAGALSATQSTQAAALVSAPGKGLKSSGLRTVLFGHSYMDQEAVSGTNVIEGFTSLGTVAWANVLLDKPLQIVREYALGGFRLLDMIPNYAANIAPLRPDVLVVSLGHNDLKGLYPAGGTGQPVAQAAADTQQTQLPYLIGKIRAWLDTDVSARTQVFFLAETPPGQDVNGASTVVSPQLAVRFQQWNRALWALAREYGNVHYVPTDRATTDPASTVGINRLYYYYDQVHPSVIGGYARGKMLASYMARVLPIHADPLPWSAVDTHKNCAITTTSAPSSDGTTLTIPLSNGTATLKLIEVGDKVQLQPGTGVTAADKLLVGRFAVLTATTTAITCACSVTATASTTMKVSNSRQLFENPLMLTTTGGNAGGFSNTGTLAGTWPLGVDVSGVDTGLTVAVSTATPHTKRDGATGFGNWLALTITNASGAARSFTVRFQCSAKSASPGTYDVIRKAHSGVTYQAGCEYKQVSVPAAYNGMEWLLYMRPADVAAEIAGTGVSARDLYRDTSKLTANSALFGWPAEDFQGTLLTPEYTPDVGPGNFAELVQMQATFFMSGNGGPFTVYVGRAGLWAVDDAVQSGRISLQT